VDIEMTLLQHLKGNGFCFAPTLDGVLHRFDHAGELDGWYVGNKYYLTYGSWKTGQRCEWQVDCPQHTPAQNKILQEEIRKAKEEAQRHQAEEQKVKAEAAEKLFEHLHTNRTTELHPYLKAKGIKFNYKAKHASFDQYEELSRTGERVKTCFAGNLYIALHDINHKLWSRQSIYKTDKWHKQILGRKAGCFHVIPTRASLSNAAHCYIAEGFATAATVFEATGTPTIMAVDAGNLGPVSQAITKKYPNLKITFAADNDTETKNAKGEPDNVGIRKARAAAQKIKGSHVVHPIQSGDFNDLFQAKGSEETRKQLQPKDTKGNFQLIPWDEFCEKTDDNIEWLVQDFYSLGGVSSFIGREKIGKTTVIRQLCHAILTGKDFLGRKTKTGPVWYLTLDENPRWVKNKFKVLQIPKDAPLHLLTEVYKGELSTHFEHC